MGGEEVLFGEMVNVCGFRRDIMFFSCCFWFYVSFGRIGEVGDLRS